MRAKLTELFNIRRFFVTSEGLTHLLTAHSTHIKLRKDKVYQTVEAEKVGDRNRIDDLDESSKHQLYSSPPDTTGRAPLFYSAVWKQRQAITAATGTYTSKKHCSSFETMWENSSIIHSGSPREFQEVIGRKTAWSKNSLSQEALAEQKIAAHHTTAIFCHLQGVPTSAVQPTQPKAVQRRHVLTSRVLYMLTYVVCSWALKVTLRFWPIMSLNMGCSAGESENKLLELVQDRCQRPAWFFLFFPSQLFKNPYSTRVLNLQRNYILLNFYD